MHKIMLEISGDVMDLNFLLLENIMKQDLTQ